MYGRQTKVQNVFREMTGEIKEIEAVRLLPYSKGQPKLVIHWRYASSCQYTALSEAKKVRLKANPLSMK